jgi:XTP/dITP diphosphohydrolase
MKRKLVLATTNRGKIAEFRELFANLDIEVISIADAVPTPFVVDENQPTFKGNATKKAVAAATITNMLSLADDSGLEVDALDGAPGVRSARYAGEHATAEENNAALIAALRAKGGETFSARFRCALVLVDPHGETYSVVGVTEKMEGHVILEPRGSNGFGYDPLFVPAGFDRTFAELSAEEKNSLSHRAKALAQIVPKLAQFLSARNM